VAFVVKLDVADDVESSAGLCFTSWSWAI